MNSKTDITTLPMARKFVRSAYITRQLGIVGIIGIVL